jgi:CDP-diacylglycerol---serine O-phosphatidyltransferase
MLIAYPWVILTGGTLAYLASLPFGWLSYRGYERRAEDTKTEESPTAAHSVPASRSAAAEIPLASENEDRPSRLN